MYACVHERGYMREVTASAHDVRRLYWDDTNINCLSVKRRAKRDRTLSGERHSNRGKSGMLDQTLGWLLGGHRNDIA
jgi:hypothetical protein